MFGAHIRYAAPVRTLMVFAGAFVFLAALFALAASVDARILEDGESVWIKPLRFAIAFAAHAATIAWIGVLTRRAAAQDRFFAVSALLQAAVMAIEILCIAIQAARGVESHFNYATPFDRAIFTIMGLGTAGLFAGFLLIIVGLIRRPRRLLASWAVGIAMVFAVLGGMAGVVMVMPTAEQAVLLEAGVRPGVIGSHVVRVPSEAKLMFFGWELAAGDWRVPHFLGLHAMQALPLIVWLCGAGRTSGWSALALATVGYGAIVVWSFGKTFAGQPVFQLNDLDALIVALGIGLYALGVGVAGAAGVRLAKHDGRPAAAIERSRMS